MILTIITLLLVLSITCTITTSTSTNNNSSRSNSSNNNSSHNKSNRYQVFPSNDIISNLCSINDIYNGSWIYGNRLSNNNDNDIRVNIIRNSMINNISLLSSSLLIYNHSNNIFNNLYDNCPKTFNSIINSKLRDQLFKYSCNNYLNATYYTNNKCIILNLYNTLKLYYHYKIKSHNHYIIPKIIIVGDSLSGQIYIALKCIIENYNINININYIIELFYLPHIPCNDQCIDNKIYRDNNNNNIINPCHACPNGIRKNFTLDKINYKNFTRNYWYNQITPDTRILVLGGGSWFNYYKGIINSTETYIQMLMFVGKLILKIKHERVRSLQVFWIDLPPIIPGYNKVYPNYEWGNFQDKNDYAKKILPDYGIHVLDTSNALYSRKRDDIAISEPSSLHWCNPGEASAPTFISTTILHLYSRLMLKTYFNDIIDD